MEDYQELTKILNSDLSNLNKNILKSLNSDVVLINEVSKYIIDSGGKKLRPVLMLFFQKLISESDSSLNEKVIKMASAIEFIHTATLLHDDVVDDSALRRNKITANSLFGNAASILVGDFLYSRAFQIMVSIKSDKIMQIMADTTNKIAEGEVLQLMNCNDPELNEEQYLKVIKFKTGKLFEASCMIPAILAGSNQNLVNASGNFGLHIGTAFQLTDDVLDYNGSEDEIGKKLGDDLREGKPTLPLIHLIKTINDSKEKKLLKLAIEKPESASFSKIIHLIRNSDALEYTKNLAVNECNKAKKELSNFPDNIFKKKLINLLAFVTSRKN